MKKYQSLADATEAAIKVSKDMPGTYVGLFKDRDGRYYHSYTPLQININDECVANFLNGDLTD